MFGARFPVDVSRAGYVPFRTELLANPRGVPTDVFFAPGVLARVHVFRENGGPATRWRLSARDEAGETYEPERVAAAQHVFRNLPPDAVVVARRGGGDGVELGSVVGRYDWKPWLDPRVKKRVRKGRASGENR